jgi:O-antigen ligase
MVWVLVVLMIVPEGLDYDGLMQAGSPTAGGAVSRGLWLAVLAISLGVLARRWALAARWWRQLNPAFPLMIALAIASVAWSIDPALSLRRLYRLCIIALACAAFVLVAWEPRRLQNVLRPVLTGVLLASLPFGLIFPEWAIHSQTSPELLGAWRGLTNHKNGFGGLACITALLWWHALLAREVAWPKALLGLAVSALCLLLSRSTTALAATLAMAAFITFALRLPAPWRRHLPVLVWASVLALLVYTLALLQIIPGFGVLMAPVGALSSKDSTFTGRTDIWALITEHIRARPWLGSGYAAFWTAVPTPGTEAWMFVQRMGAFYPGSAHNGYLEVQNDLGAAGLLGLLAYLGFHVMHTLRLLRFDYTQAVLLLALFFQQAITNVSETHWFSVLSVDFVLMSLATTTLARGLLEQRLRRAPGYPFPKRAGEGA